MSTREASGPGSAATFHSNTGRLLQRRCACGQHTGGGDCQACARKSGFLQRHSGVDQVGGGLSGLRVSAPGDPYEREADHLAAKVLAWPAEAGAAPPLRATPTTPLAQNQVSTGDTGQTAPVEARSVAEVVRDGGRPLPGSVRDFFEPRFGHHFGEVRVHTDGRAASTASALGADAFTVGQHVVFGPRRFEPTTPAGQRLLAHELSHVLQQRGGSPGVAVSPGGGPTLVQRRTSFSAAAQAGGSSLGWKHPGSEALLVADDGKMAVEDKGWKNSKRVWALDPLIASSNSILTAQGSRVRLKVGGTAISGKAPSVPAEPTRTLSEVKVESESGGPLTLTGDCGQACKEVMGSPTDPEESVAVARNPKGIERYTPARTYESRSTSASGKATTEEWSEDIFKMEFGTGLTRDQALKKYDDLSAADKTKFDEKHGINKFAVPRVGQGVSISTEYDMPGFAKNPGKSTWNFHFATSILASGDDYVSLENIARRANTAWFFWMYGPESKGQSFHQFQGAMGEHGNKFTSMVVQPEKLLEGKINGDGVHLVGDPDQWSTTLLGTLARGTQVAVQAKGARWRKVIVLSGTHISKVGWISSAFFEQK